MGISQLKNQFPNWSTTRRGGLAAPGVALDDRPLAFVQADAAATAIAEPATGIPALATLGTGVESLHLAVTLADIRLDLRHEVGQYCSHYKDFD